MSFNRLYNQLGERVAFHNRVSELDSIAAVLKESRDSNDSLKLVTLLGMGGFGKTSIMKKFSDSVSQNPEIQPIWVSLSVDSNSRIIGPLLVLRRQLEFECALFDTAVATYYTVTGLSLKGLEREENFALKIMETVGAVIGITLPINLAVEIYKKLSRRNVINKRYHLSDFEEIDRLRKAPFELLEFLPYCLAKDIRIQMSGERKTPVFFYDSYEKQSSTSLKSDSSWLQLFISELGCCVHIVASRELMKWRDSEWGDTITILPIGTLSEFDSQHIVRTIVKDDPELVNQILSVAKGIPFYLTACLTVYAQTRTRPREYQIALYSNTIDKVTEQLISHLTESRAQAILCLAGIQVFNEKYFSILVRELNLSVSTLDFRNVTSLFFIEPYNVAPGFYKTHDLITEFVRSRRSDILEHCTRIAADYCSVLIKQDQSDNSVAFLYAPLLRACSLCKANAELHTKLILIGYWMYDKGMWNELMSAFDDSEVKPSTGSFEIARFFYGMCMRRREGVKAGQRILSSISRNAIVADYLPFPLEIELAYLNALSGDYGLARHQISDIHSRVHIFDFTNRTHAKCRLYYCDLLILDGQFLTASMLLQEVLDREDHISVLDRAEFIRSRGHASRLSFQLEEAETLYLLALRHAAGSPAIEAKLLTNLAETFAITRPTRARTEALTAMDINYRLGNVIEVGKCEVVLAIASAAVGQLHSASDHCTRAHIIFQNANYKAGLLFAEIANCLIAWKSSRKADAYSALKKCGIFVEEMGVYKSLLLVPAMLLTDTASVEEIMKDTQWLERHEVTAVVNDALSQFLNS